MLRHTARLLLLILHLPVFVLAQDDSTRLQWFRDAKLGIFIHWGIYSVDGVDESWSFYNNKISYAQYMSQLKGFTARNYDPENWAGLIAQSGARYAVITTKHHDGVALYDSRVSTLDVVNSTPARRDVLTPFFKALRNRNIRTGAYFSLIDWSHPDYPGFRRDSSRYNAKEYPKRWEKFLAFYRAQLSEVKTLLNPDLWWFDGDWEHDAAQWQAADVRKELLTFNKDAIINGRLAGYGDYATPEQNFPVSRPTREAWELCLTSNSNWGYHPDDTAYKTPYQLITIFADVLHYGGNLLFDIGPREDGWIPDEQVHLLKELGSWNRKHEEAIFSSLPGMPAGHFYGPSTLSRDSGVLYLFLPSGTPGPVMLKGIRNAVKKIRIVGTTTSLPHRVVGKISWSPVPGLIYIDPVPESSRDRYMTLLALELDGPLRLYRGQGGLTE